MTTPIVADLSPSDVHRPSTVGGDEPRRQPASLGELLATAGVTTSDPPPTGAQTMSDATQLISADKRKALPEDKFALPGKRKYPIDTPGRIRNAAARLEQQRKRGKISDAEYHEAKGRIAKAAKAHGIDSEYNATDNSFKGAATPAAGGRVHVRADLAPGGSLHVGHHLRAFHDGEAVQLSADSAPVSAGEGVAQPAPVWIQLARQGAFAGHPSGRPFKLDRRAFETMIANFKANKDGRLPIDFEHASEQAPNEGSLPVSGAPAQGWIVDLSIRADGNLWALVEWGDLARSYIREGKYRFISPAFHLKMKDRETGREIGPYLSSAGLTNQPFLDGMQPLAARRDGGDFLAGPVLAAAGDFYSRAMRQPHEYMPRIREALRLGDVATHDEMQTQLTRLREACTLADADGMHEGVDLRGTYLAGLATCAGMGDDDSPEDILDVVEEMIDAAIERHVEQYHDGGAANLSARPGNTTNNTTEGDAMSDKDTETLKQQVADLTAANKDLQGKLDKLQGQYDTQAGEVTTLSTKAKRVEALEPVAATVEASLVLLKGSKHYDTAKPLDAVVKAVLEENATLLKAIADREETDAVADVDRAIEEHKLDPSRKPHLLNIRRKTPDDFAAMFRPLSPEERRLLTNVVKPVERKPPSDPKSPTLLSMSQLISRIMQEKPGTSYQDAEAMASRQIREATEAAQ